MKNKEICRIGYISHTILDKGSLSSIVKQLRKKFSNDNDICYIGNNCFRLSERDKKVQEDRSDKLVRYPGLRITDGYVKVERSEKQFYPIFEHMIEIANTSLVVVDKHNKAHFIKKRGYAVIKYYPNPCDTFVMTLTSDNKIIAASIADDYELNNYKIKLMSGKGHLLITSTDSSESTQFNVLFTASNECCSPIIPNIPKEGGNSSDMIRPTLFCELNDYCLTQFGGKVYLLGNKITDTKPVALIKVSDNMLQSISILQITALVMEKCFEANEQLVIGKEYEISEDKAIIKKSDTNFIFVSDNESMMASISELMQTILPVTNNNKQFKINSINFGDIHNRSLVVHVNDDGYVKEFEFEAKERFILKYKECVKHTDIKRPRLELTTRMKTTDRKHDKKRYPISIDKIAHTLCLDDNAILYIRDVTNKVNKVQSKGFAFISGYLIVITRKGGTVCPPKEVKLIRIEDGQHFLISGQSGHILFVGCGSLLVFDPINTEDDHIIRYFMKSINEYKFGLDSDSEDDKM